MSDVDNRREPSVDYVIKELEKIYVEQYKPKRNTKNLYEQVIISVTKFENIKHKNDVLCAIQDIINSNSTYRKIESITWGNIFIILGLFTTILSDIIINNYSKLDYLSKIIDEQTLIGVFILLIAIEVSLYLLSHFGSIKKNRRRCFYEFVFLVY